VNPVRFGQWDGIGAESESMARMLYLYLWPFPYFRDVTRGRTLERQQNYRHNRAMRVHLPGFAIKWALIMAACFGTGSALGAAACPLAIAALCYVAGSWAFILSLLMITSWCWLERFPELY
jgi:hypothetical protein